MTAHTFSDLDGDADVDGQDFLTLSSCFNGSLRPPKPGCKNPMADLDIDGDVDGQDFMTLSGCFNGSMRPPKCEPSSFAAGMSVVDNPYFFTGREVDVFDLAEGGGEAATGGGDEPLVGSADGSGGLDGGSLGFWSCFYSATDSAAGPLDFNGDGDVAEDDLLAFLACVADMGDWTTESLFGIVGGEGATLDGGPAVIGQTPGLVLYHYRARAQHPTLGRFNQRDPLGFADGMNVYVYAKSNPAVYQDPYGEIAVLPVLVGTAAFMKGAEACIYGYACVSCMNTAYEYTKRMRDNAAADVFSTWLKNARPGSECAGVCGAAAGYLIQRLYGNLGITGGPSKPAVPPLRPSRPPRPSRPYPVSPAPPRDPTRPLYPE